MIPSYIKIKILALRRRYATLGSKGLIYNNYVYIITIRREKCIMLR